MPKLPEALVEKKPKPSQIASQPAAPDLGLGDWEFQVAGSNARTFDAISPRYVMALQRMVGNQTVQRMLARPDLTEANDAIATTTPVDTSLPALSKRTQTIQRSPTSKVSSFSASADANLIQRQTVLASKPGHIHEIKGALSNNAKQKVRQIQKAKKRQKYRRFDDIEIDDDQSKHIVDGKNQVVWYQVMGSPNQYVLAEKVLTSFQSKPTNKDIDDSDPELETDSKTDLFDSSGEIVNEVDNAMVDVLRGYTLKEDVYGEELSDSEVRTQTDTTIAEGVFWAGGGAMGMVSGILGMASSLKDMMSDEKTTWEKVEAAFNLVASGSDVVAGAYGVTGGVSQLVNSGSTEGTAQYDNSEAIAGWAFGFQGMFGALSSGIKTILDVVSLVRMIVQQVRGKESFDRDEWLSKAGSLLNNALETAKGVITTFRAIWEVVNDAVTGVFETVLPGIDIAIAATKSIFQGYYLVKSAYHWFRMVLAGRTAKKNLKSEGFNKRSRNEAIKFYGKREGLISNTEHLIGKNTKAIGKREKKLDKSTKKTDSKYTVVNKWRNRQRKKWNKEISSLTKDKDTATDIRDIAQQEISDYENNTIDSTGAPIPIPSPRDDSSDQSSDQEDSGDSSPQVDEPTPIRHPARLQLSELRLSQELSSANAKRVVRQAIHIGTNLVKIAGSIVTIAAGTGAPAGVAIKAAAAGVDISLPFFRSLKEFGRNKAGIAKAKGKKNLFTKVFNSDKSNVAKLQHRKKQAVTILMMIADLNKILPTSPPGPARQAERKKLQMRVQHIERYMYAAGVSPKKLYRANGKPAEQIKLLVEAMCKRELLG